MNVLNASEIKFIENYLINFKEFLLTIILFSEIRKKLENYKVNHIHDMSKVIGLNF